MRTTLTRLKGILQYQKIVKLLNSIEFEKCYLFWQGFEFNRILTVLNHSPTIAWFMSVTCCHSQNAFHQIDTWSTSAISCCSQSVSRPNCCLIHISQMMALRVHLSQTVAHRVRLSPTVARFKSAAWCHSECVSAKLLPDLCQSVRNADLHLP